ncbi:11446_t:CDS:2, partial [Racocetra persica]
NTLDCPDNLLVYLDSRQIFTSLLYCWYICIISSIVACIWYNQLKVGMFP